MMEPPHLQGEPLWLTAYLFFEGDVYGETADRVIREVVAPLARACRRDAVRWFFLRYDEEARRLARRALWEGTACTWEVLDPQPDPEIHVRTTRAEGQLYQGAAGIAWFLGELYRATGEAEVGRAARGGLEHSLARGDRLSDLFGFHSGRMGIAWVAVRLAGIFERPDYAERARRLLAPLAGREPDDAGLDVIGGAGGAIPACLDLAGKTGWDELRAMARKLGGKGRRRHSLAAARGRTSRARTLPIMAGREEPGVRREGERGGSEVDLLPGGPTWSAFARTGVSGPGRSQAFRWNLFWSLSLQGPS